MISFMHILFVLVNFVPGVWQDTTAFVVSKLLITSVARFLKKCILRHDVWVQIQENVACQNLVKNKCKLIRVKLV